MNQSLAMQLALHSILLHTYKNELNTDSVASPLSDTYCLVRMVTGAGITIATNNRKSAYIAVQNKFLTKGRNRFSCTVSVL